MAPRFEGYVEPRVTVNPEPRAEAQVEERGRMPAESEARVTRTSTTTTTAVDDRRQRVRAKVNYFACVLSETFGKDVVTCIDMSRGGLGFRTKNAYAISAEVTVAVPFFAGIAERAGDLCAGAGSEYPGIAGIENFPVWRGVFARGGDAGALLKRISWLAPRLFWLRRSRNFLHRWQGLCRPWRANRWRAVRGGGRCA
jgi:hypothetical protein